MGSEPTTGRGAARLRRLPSWLAGQVAGRGHRLVGEALAQEGCRRHHYAVLTVLAETGPASQSEVGRRLWLDRSDMHAVVGDLEASGLLARTRDQEDRRRNRIALTPAGGKTLERLDALVDAAQEALLAPLPTSDREQLVRLLAQLAEAEADGR